MRRGTTPVNNFDVTLDLTTATEIFITYEQNEKSNQRNNNNAG